jgi:hypothetical protein
MSLDAGLAMLKLMVESHTHLPGLCSVENFVDATDLRRPAKPNCPVVMEAYLEKQLD